MDITLLPQEIFEVISLLLSLRDILACSLVSIGWRNAINSNKIWRSLCSTKFGIKNSFCELITTPNLVKPQFVFPQNHYNRFTDVCQWRIRFMQEVHILNNLRKGRYVSKIITKINIGETTESEGNIIVVLNNEKRSFTSWNIGDDIIINRTVYFSLNNMLASFFKLCNDIIVIAQCTLLQVFFKTEDNNFILKHRFIYNKSIEDSKKIPNTPDITSWYSEMIGLYPCDITMCCDHNGKYFVGVILEGDLNNALIHIWDISWGIKRLEQRVPSLIDPIIDIRFTINNCNLILLFKVLTNYKKCTKIYCLNLNTLTYTNMVITFDYPLPVVLVRDPYILTADITGYKIFLWRIFDGTLVYKMISNFYLNFMVMQFADSFVLLSINTPFSHTVKVLNINTLQIVSEFSTGFSIVSLTLIKSGLMLIRGPNEFGIWDSRTGIKLHTIKEIFLCRHYIWSNENCSKILLETESNDLYLFHFW